MQEIKPRLTIITCTYNSEDYLEECVKSVENQTFRDFEHIFIDAFSSDATLKIIKEYQERRPYQVRLYQYPLKGISNAMNLGIKQAKGDIILHLHGDDYLYSNDILRKVNEIFNKSNISILVGNSVFKKDELYFPVWPQNKLINFVLDKFIKNLLFFRNGISHPSTYLKKFVFDKWGLFDESLEAVMDYEYWFRVFKKERVMLINDFLSVYRVHPKTLSNLKEEEAKVEINKIFNKYKNSYRWERFFNFIFIRPLIKLFKLSVIRNFYRKVVN